MTQGTRLPASAGYVLSALALIAAVLCGLCIGDVKIMTPPEVLRTIVSRAQAMIDAGIDVSLIWQIRLPRVLAAAMSGAVLASGGVIFQAVLRNQLAEPYTLGVASGASLGVSIAIFVGSSWITPFAFMGSVIALAAVMILGERNGGDDVSGVILAGVIVGSVMGAGQTLIRALAGEKLSAMVLWVMGSFSSVRDSFFAGGASGGSLWNNLLSGEWWDVRLVAVAFLTIVVLNMAFIPELDILSAGGDGAHLGVDVSRTRLILLTGASLAVSIVVSRFGVIGFVGLVAPHIFRTLFGPSHARLLLMSSMGGAALLVGADTVAKSLNDLPVGVLTVLIGGPVFCYILWRRKN
jgi:iron complex transport system permease protein